MEAIRLIIIILLGSINMFGTVSESGVKNGLFTNILRLVALGLIIFICSN